MPEARFDTATLDRARGFAGHAFADIAVALLEISHLETRRLERLRAEMARHAASADGSSHGLHAPEPPAFSLDHIELRVTRLNAARDFFTDLAGIEIAASPDNPAAGARGRGSASSSSRNVTERAGAKF